MTELQIIIAALVPILTGLVIWLITQVHSQGQRLARIEGQFDLVIPQLKVVIDQAKDNPAASRKNDLLDKLKDDTIAKDEAIELQSIMDAEIQSAKEENNTLKALIGIGVLALIGYALSKRS